jgi:prepilin-type N-terminal cleavage/methylation domain-containing protein
MISTYIKTKGRKGFTLIELMVAIGVTALLVSLMLTITINVLGGWNKSSGSLTSGNQARLVLDMISRDLQGAIIKKDDNVWLAATIQQSQTGSGDARVVGAVWNPPNPKPSLTLLNATATQIEDPSSLNTQSLLIPDTSRVDSNGVPIIPSLESYRFGQGGVWFRFLTSIADTNANSATISGPRAVSYQIVRAPVVANSNVEYRYTLFRSEVDSAKTFTNGFDLFAAVYDSPTPPVAVTDPGILRTPEVTIPNRGLVIANNVIDFGVRIYTRNSLGVLSTVPAFPKALSNSVYTTGFAATTSTTVLPAGGRSSAQIAYSGTPTVGFPAVVEVFIRVLTDEGVMQIDNLENGLTTGSTWWDIALKNSKVFTRRIELNANPL